jgi:hypothetical protein
MWRAAKTWRPLARGSGLDRHLENLVGGVTGSFVDPLDCYGVRRLGQAENSASFRVGPCVLEVDSLIVLDVEICLMGFRQLVCVIPFIPSWTSMSSGTVLPP